MISDPSCHHRALDRGAADRRRGDHANHVQHRHVGVPAALASAGPADPGRPAPRRGRLAPDPAGNRGRAARHAGRAEQDAWRTTCAQIRRSVWSATATRRRSRATATCYGATVICSVTPLRPAHFTPAALQAALEADVQLLGSDMGMFAKGSLAADPTGEMLRLVGAFGAQAHPAMHDGVWVSPNQEPGAADGSDGRSRVSTSMPRNRRCSGSKLPLPPLGSAVLRPIDRSQPMPGCWKPGRRYSPFGHARA